MRRWAALLSIVLMAACSGGGRTGTGGAASSPTPTPRDLTEFSSAECPKLPKRAPDTGQVALWPDEKAGDLVPELESACASPTSPYLFGLLNEEAGWSSGDIEAAALGLLHRGTETLGTFTAIRVKPGTPGLEEAAESLASGGATTTAVGDMTLAWARAGDHAVVYWFDDEEIISIAAGSGDHAAESAELWLRGQGEDVSVVPPYEVPALGPMAPALDAGPPLAGFPEGYAALPIDPVSFMQADFADAVTMNQDNTIDALGAAVLLSRGNRVMGTLVAGAGTTELADWAKEFKAGGEGAPAAGFEAGSTSGFVVGYDQDKLDNFVEKWEKGLTE